MELRALFLLFFRLGLTAFGGPAAHVAIMRDEIVTRRAWLTSAEFLDFVGATNLIPGPNSTELAMHVGRHRAGLPGLVVAGTSFLAPAATISACVAAAYVRYGTLPEVRAATYGIQPVLVAVVVQALVGLGRTALVSGRLVVLGGLALALTIARVHEIAILVAAGLLAIVFRPSGTDAPSADEDSGKPGAALLTLPSTFVGLGATGAVAYSGSTLFLVCLKIGSILFGSGYVLLAFLRTEFVERRGWLTERQLLDAVAVGQTTPGPVFSTATFVGGVLGGPSGALLATLGIFLPSFVFVAMSGALVPVVRRSPVARAFLDGVNVASLALMAVVTFDLGRAAIVDLPTILIAIAGATLLLRFRTNATVLVAAGGALGLAVKAWSAS
ncbi:MAG: chromate efflux transporter [Polyangiaceae bacterium]